MITPVFLLLYWRQLSIKWVKPAWQSMSFELNMIGVKDRVLDSRSVCDSSKRKKSFVIAENFRIIQYLVPNVFHTTILSFGFCLTMLLNISKTHC